MHSDDNLSNMYLVIYLYMSPALILNLCYLCNHLFSNLFALSSSAFLRAKCNNCIGKKTQISQSVTRIPRQHCSGVCRSKRKLQRHLKAQSSPEQAAQSIPYIFCICYGNAYHNISDSIKSNSI